MEIEVSRCRHGYDPPCSIACLSQYDLLPFPETKLLIRSTDETLCEDKPLRAWWALYAETKLIAENKELALAPLS